MRPDCRVRLVLAVALKMTALGGQIDVAQVVTERSGLNKPDIIDIPTRTNSMLRFLYAYRLDWPAWKFGILKVAMVAFGILIGSAFPEFWRPLHTALWIVFGITAAISALWGLQAMAKFRELEQAMKNSRRHLADGK